MPERDHTDIQALDALYNRPVAPAPTRTGVLRTIWLWLREDLFREPYEIRGEDLDDAVLRRIRIHERGTASARRLRKLNRDDARAILEVTAMLLGFDAVITGGPAHERRP